MPETDAVDVCDHLPAQMPGATAAAVRAKRLMVTPDVSFDELERSMRASKFVVPPAPVVHRFTKGMYIREIHMAAGTLLTSKIHKTQHPFVVSKGKVDVYVPRADGSRQRIQRIEAPHLGITEPGARRVIHVIEDTIWTTFHPNPDDIRDLNQIEAMCIMDHSDHIQPMIGGPQ